MATFGGNAVISADEKLHPWLNEWVKGKKGFWLFEQHNFYELECELRKHGYRMALTHHMLLPEKDTSDFKTDINVKWLDQEDIQPYYGSTQMATRMPFQERMIPVRSWRWNSITIVRTCRTSRMWTWNSPMTTFRRMWTGIAREQR